MEIREYLAAQQNYFERNMADFLPNSGQYPQILRQAMEYSLYAGGKRLRPVLTLATAEACGGQLSAAMAPAAALEMIHTYSLIHDDLPAMDDDDLRRGKPTCHKVFGDGMAILAGDALLTHAFSAVAQAENLDAQQVVALVRELAGAAGPLGMVAGQALDISVTEIKDPTLLNRIHRCKTGALFSAAVRCGAITARASNLVLDGLTKYADALGFAYQVVDDILDVTKTSAQLGKNPGSDAKQGKVTFVTLYGLDEARSMVHAETQRAVTALTELPGDWSVLQDLALFIGQRSN